MLFKKVVLTAACIGLFFVSPSASAQSGKPKLVREPAPDETPETAANPAKAEYNPLKAEKYLNVGKYYFGQNNWIAASGRFREALKFRPDYPDAYRWLARSFEKQKKYKDAVDALAEYEQKFPKSPYLEELRKERQRLEQKLAKS